MERIECMVVGTGIDVIEVERIKRAAVRELFLQRIFTAQEQEYYRQCDCNPQILAGIFAAKEATVKALAAGFSGFSWKDIEILRDTQGQPYARLWNSAYQRMRDLGGNTIHLSISHVKSLAVAQAILEE